MIHFRTRYRDASPLIGWSDALVASPWHEWSQLRPYTLSEDARNIVWKKSTHKEIITKVQATPGKIRVLCVHIPEHWDTFKTPGTVSKMEWKQQSTRTIQISAKKWWHLYLRDDTYSISLLRQKKIRHTLIILLAGETIIQHTELKQLAYQNDLIVAIPYHPWEASPDDSYMITGKVWDISRSAAYHDAWNRQQKNIQKHLQSWGIPSFFISTDQKIEDRLNYFFKHRYG